MSRVSGDELNTDGSILNGFDYNLQVWVKDGICEPVGSGKEYAGQKVNEIPGHEVRV